MILIISWGSYFTAISIILIVYYAIVFLLYYRPEMQRILRPGRSIGSNNPKRIIDQKIAESDSELFPKVHILTEELQQLISYSAQNAQSREHLLNALKSKLSDHHYLVGSAFHPAINKFLKEETAKQCSIHFSEEDLCGFWTKSEEH